LREEGVEGLTQIHVGLWWLQLEIVCFEQVDCKIARWSGSSIEVVGRKLFPNDEGTVCISFQSNRLIVLIPTEERCSQE